MDEQNTVLEEDILDTETDNDEYIDETEYADEADDQEEPEADESDVEDDVEIEYDEDGNVLEGVADEDEDAPADESEAASNGTEPVNARTDKHADEGGEDFRAKYEALRRQTGDTLKKLGVTTEDPLEGLESLAADAEGLTLEEYRSKKSEAERTERANNLLKQQEFAALAAQDLAALQSEFPETRAYKSLLDMPAEVRQEFGKLREKGLSPKQAYAAANVDGIRNTVAASVKKSTAKGHLQTAVPKGAKDASFRMTRAQLEEARSIFPGYSDQKIIALYKQVSKN